MAVVMPSTHSTVSSADMSGDSDTSPANGIRKKRMLTPEIDRMLPASTVPAALAGGDTSRRSSICPTAKITRAASTTPSGTVLATNTACRLSDRQPTNMPLRKPSRIAAPPSSAVGRVCTRRSSGACTAPTLNERRRNSGVVSSVTSAAAAMTGR